MLLLLTALPACVKERVVRESFGSLRTQADAPYKGRSSAMDPTGGGWTIELASLEGDDRYVRAQQIFSELHRHELPQLWYEDVGPRTIVYCGRFSDPAQPEAALAVDLLKSLKIDGDKPFSRVKLKPISTAVNVQIDPLDLRQYAGFYTLEIAVFSREYGGDRRAAAEKLARDMRADGEDSYFYHGPNSSSVCIGLFDDADFILEGITNVPGPRMRQVQETHPGYRINGIDAKDVPPPPAEGDDAPLPMPKKSHFVKVL